MDDFPLMDRCHAIREADGLSWSMESRRWPRHATSLVIKNEGGVMQECRGNVSKGGFFCETDLALVEGQSVVVLFRLPGAGFWVQAEGEILAVQVFDDPPGVRGRFTRIDLGDPVALADWLRSIHLFPTASFNLTDERS